MVLRLVNFVNHGLAKGPPTKDTGVMAFKVDAVVRLKDFRSTSAQGVSLLHVLLAHLGHPALHEALKGAAKGAKGASKGAAQEERKDEASAGTELKKDAKGAPSLAELKDAKGAPRPWQAPASKVEAPPTIVARLKEELDGVEAAVKADFGELRKNLSDLFAEVSFLESELAAANGDGMVIAEPGEEGNYARVVDGTLTMCRKLYSEAERAMELYNESTVALLEAFGERTETDPRKRDQLVQAFFGNLHQSLTMLNQAWAEIAADVKKEKFSILA